MTKKTKSPGKSHTVGSGLQILSEPHGKQKLRVLLKANKRRKYVTGTHGSARFQRTTLGTTGARHESEHVIGYNVYAPTHDRKHGEGKKIELSGLAYLEIYDRHRAHPGTGSGAAADRYREEQRGILEHGKSDPALKTVSSAIQYNQLEYAHLGPAVETGHSAKDLTVMEISYAAMVLNGDRLTYHDGTTSTSFGISQVERAEMLLAYETRKTGAWPTPDRIKEVLRYCGLDPIVKTIGGKEVVT